MHLLPAAGADSRSVRNCVLLFSAVEQEAFESFNKQITAGQVTPAPRHLRMLGLPCWVTRFLGSLFRLRCVIETSFDVCSELLQHLCLPHHRTAGSAMSVSHQRLAPKIRSR